MEAEGFLSTSASIFMNEKKFRLKFSIDDYVRVLTFMQRQNFINKYAVVIFPTIVFVCFISSVIFMANDINKINFEEIIWAGLTPTAVVAVIMLLMDKFVAPFFLKRTVAKQYKSSPAMQEEQSIVFTDDGMEYSNSLSSGEIKWGAIIKAVESKTDFLFYTSNKFAHFVPKNAFDSEADVIWLQCLSRAKLGDKAKF